MNNSKGKQTEIANGDRVDACPHKKLVELAVLTWSLSAARAQGKSYLCDPPNGFEVSAVQPAANQENYSVESFGLLAFSYLFKTLDRSEYSNFFPTRRSLIINTPT